MLNLYLLKKYLKINCVLKINFDSFKRKGKNIESKKKFEAKDYFDSLLVANHDGNNEVVEFLLNHGANIEAINKINMTALNSYNFIKSWCKYRSKR